MGNVSRKIATKSKRKYEKTHRSTNKRCKRFYTFAHFLRSDNAHGNVAIPLINRPILGDLNVQWCKNLFCHYANLEQTRLFLYIAYAVSRNVLLFFYLFYFL